MDSVQLVYASRPFGFDEAVINQILAKSRVNNTRDELSGALVCRADLYLQLLEGPALRVEAAYERIRRDDRHVDVNLLVRRQTADRMFASWAMRGDPARSWMWTRAEIADGAVERATEAEILAIFARLKAEPPEVHGEA